MTLHIVTVVYQDDTQLTDTCDSCDMGDRIDVRHWIFVKHYDAAIQGKYPHATVLASQDSGIYNAMNLAFATLEKHLSEDDVVVFMNAGDRFIESELFEHLAEHSKRMPDISIAGVELTRKGTVIGTRLAPTVPSDPGAIIYRDFPCHQATFYSARLLNLIWHTRGHLYREDFKSCADMELYLAVRHHNILTTRFTTASYDVDGFSSKQSLAIAAEKNRLLREYGGHMRWRLYASYWYIRACLVEPKQQLLRSLGKVN